MARRVMLTGAGGFLAGHFATAFAAAGWQTFGIGRSDRDNQAGLFSELTLADLSDLGAITSFAGRVAPDVLVHLAAPASVAESIDDPLADLQAHIIPTANVLYALRRSSPATRVLLISSAAVYGSPASLPISEDTRLAPISPYGFHKLQQELLFDQYAALHGLRTCKARIFSTYGERLRRLAVWEIARRALAGNPEVFGTGEESRDYLDVTEAARAVVCIADRAPFEGEAINVASGADVSVATVAAEIFRLVGLSEAPRFTGKTLPGNPIRWRADVTRLRKLGCSPASWPSGLARTVAWIAAEYRQASDV
ncbi:MAG TPA: NAD-dependent epimerase/dehydratase family protein [Thermoanaerobaculia bacterium]|nr:NAD-dependent epimerase/dehydratase family protein [Thermoanaerobaculia bacterium]